MPDRDEGSGEGGGSSPRKYGELAEEPTTTTDRVAGEGGKEGTGTDPARRDTPPVPGAGDS